MKLADLEAQIQIQSVRDCSLSNRSEMVLKFVLVGKTLAWGKRDRQRFEKHGYQ